jgi:predicted lactoylglutathione lyase
MIGYVTIGTSDMERAKAFYSELLAPLGAQVLMDMGRIALLGSAPDQPMLAVCTPFNEEATNPGNGNMVAIPGKDREQVDALWNKAIELGAVSDGEPGQRMEGFYGAYFRDADGNKVAFFYMGA